MRLNTEDWHTFVSSYDRSEKKKNNERKRIILNREQ